MKWTKAEFGDDQLSGNWRIEHGPRGYILRRGWNACAVLPTLAGCKRVAVCIDRELKTKPVQP